MTVPAKTIPPPHTKRIRAADLPVLVAQGGVQLLGVDAAPASATSAMVFGVVELPAPRSFAPSFADLVAERVVERLMTKKSAHVAARDHVASSKRSSENPTTADVPASVDTGTSHVTGDASDELLTVGDVARVLAVKRSKAYEIWATLPKVKLGPRCHRVRRDALDDLLRERERRPRWRR